ncbi:Monogalactosyldiacylglycerol synthase 3 [Hibiscus syriacus]|uniref:Monogalactosyldiacylglycerol synthase 3 n=1 Tax=Hibiscus syriacus TaxID=106335 RepID=A0A6A2XFT0_HIBSY|nr:Monogalactosyldiacylglycerol synthase 3 [Hibiscus syriacus]
MGPVKETAKALGKSLYDRVQKKPIGQLIIICGRNKALASTMESEEWKIPVKGTSYCSQRLHSRTGEGNVPYVVDNGAGFFTRSPKVTARIVARWFSTRSEELKRMWENVLKLAQPEVVFDIVKDIHQLALQKGPFAKIPYAMTSSFTILA